MMRLVLVVLLVAVGVLGSTPAKTFRPTSGCLVRPDININITKMGRKQLVKFVANIKDENVASIMNITLSDNDPFTAVLLSIHHTHANITKISYKGNQPSSMDTAPITVDVMARLRPGWREVNMEVEQNTITLTDTNKHAWVQTKLNHSMTHIEVEIHHINESCFTLTPTWEVAQSEWTEVATCPDQDYLEMTLIGESDFLPVLQVANTNHSITWDTSTATTTSTTDTTTQPTPLPARQPHRLAITRGHLAHVLARKGWLAVQMDNAGYSTVRIANQRQGSFYLIQHLRPRPPSSSQQAGTWVQSPARDDNCSALFIAAATFNWTVAACGAIIYCCLKRQKNST